MFRNYGEKKVQKSKIKKTETLNREKANANREKDN